MIPPINPDRTASSQGKSYKTAQLGPAHHNRHSTLMETLAGSPYLTLLP